MTIMVIVMIMITSLRDYDCHPLNDNHDYVDGKGKEGNRS